MDRAIPGLARCARLPRRGVRRLSRSRLRCAGGVHGGLRRTGARGARHSARIIVPRKRRRFLRSSSHQLRSTTTERSSRTIGGGSLEDRRRERLVRDPLAAISAPSADRAQSGRRRRPLRPSRSSTRSQIRKQGALDRGREWTAARVIGSGNVHHPRREGRRASRHAGADSVHGVPVSTPRSSPAEGGDEAPEQRKPFRPEPRGADSSSRVCGDRRAARALTRRLTSALGFVRGSP